MSIDRGSFRSFLAGCTPHYPIFVGSLRLVLFDTCNYFLFVHMLHLPTLGFLKDPSRLGRLAHFAMSFSLTPSFPLPRLSSAFAFFALPGASADSVVSPAFRLPLPGDDDDTPLGAKKFPRVA
jgi:hypothetical protein